MSANSVNRKIVTAGISCLLVEAGFDSADNQALETLVEMVQSCKYHSKSYTLFLILFVKQGFSVTHIII